MVNEDGKWKLLLMLMLLLLPLDRKMLVVAVQLVERQIVALLFEIDDDCY